jgi:sialate O-acetylesterase
MTFGMRRIVKFFFLLWTVFLLGQPATHAQLELMPLFSDHMVLQQRTDAAIFGKAAPGAEVILSASWGARASALADDHGDWLARLATPEAGGPYIITIKCGSESLVLSDVLIGEVWLCSGQSNMEMPLTGFHGEPVEGSATAIAASNCKQLRMFTVKREFRVEPRTTVDGEWQISSPETAGGFSATAYFFGKKLQQELGVPVGLIHSSWGGTPVEAWTPVDFLETVSGYTDIGATLADMIRNQARLDNWLSSLPVVTGDPSEPDAWNLDFGDAALAERDHDDSAWGIMELPSQFESSVLGEFDGVVWFRKAIELPDDWDGRKLVLEMGAIDDMDRIFLNGQMVGRTEEHGYWQEKRSYPIPAGVTHAGLNTIAVRVIDTGGGGGLSGPVEAMRLYPEDESGAAIPLGGEWRYLPVAELNSTGFHVFGTTWADYAQRPEIDYPFIPDSPSVLYNGMIAPLVPFGLKGVIWYQGEGNVGRHEQYRELFPTMIRSWRDRFGPDLSFYHVQIAPFRYSGSDEVGSAALRDAQNAALALPRTGQVSTLDIGDLQTIHPAKKREVGERLAFHALAKDYGYSELSHTGPGCRSARQVENEVVLTFDPGSHEMVLTEDNPSGFEFVHADGSVEPANAVLQGKQIVLQVEGSNRPVLVRYAYRNGSSATLFNSAGLPSPTFSMAVERSPHKLESPATTPK